MAIIFLISALIVFAVSIFFAYKNRHDTTKLIASVTLGILFTTFLMVLPTNWIKENTAVDQPVLYSILSSLLYSFKTLGGRSDISQLETIALSGILKTIYICINYIMFALAPILASSLILSFIGDTGEKIKFFFSRNKKIYVFSELNQNSLALAKGLLKSKEKKIMIFCNTKDESKNLITKAKDLGAILLYKSCENMKPNRKQTIFEFCLMSNSEDKNLKTAEMLVNKFRNTKSKVIINAFIESGTNVKFLESVLKSEKHKDTNIELHCIDEIALFCNHLIYDYPLYNTKDNGKNISVAIIGCGRTGMRMLKTVYWAGQIDGYTLKIRVYDKCAFRIKREFERLCPGIRGCEAIKFIAANVDSPKFQKKMLAEENSKDATYIVVAMGDDGLNLSVSDDISKIYRRSRNFEKSKMPEIFTRVRSEDKTSPYFNDTDFLEKRNIHLFGTTESIFSNTTIFNSELENMAFAVHLTYRNKLCERKNSPEFQEVYYNFKTSEYDRRSSMAAALHIPAKLCACDKVPKTDKNNLNDENIAKFSECIKNDKELCKRLAENEHARWNAFMLSEGFETATLEEMMLYSKTNTDNDHKDELTMLHPCITDLDSIDKLEKIYNELYGKDKNFTFYDKEIVEKIPLIWKTAKNMNGDN